RGDYINKKRHAEVWTNALGAKLVHQILPMDIERQVAKWRVNSPNNASAKHERGLSGASINRLLAFLKRAYSVAIKDKLCDSNPVRDVGFEPEFARERYLTEDEEERLKEALSAEDWAVVEFAIHTGLRQANQFRLRWDQIDLRAGLMIIPGGMAKNGEPIYQPMNDTIP